MRIKGRIILPTVVYNMSIMIEHDGDSQFLDLNSAFPPTGSSGPSLGIDMLMNKHKISRDGVISLQSSGSSSSRTSSVHETTEDEASVEEEDGGFGASGGYGGGSSGQQVQQDNFKSRIVAEAARQEQVLSEKRDILWKLDRLESRGYNVPRKFTMASDIEEMRAEYQRIVREKEIEGSIKMQQNVMMAFVTGLELLNTRFDPFGVELDGFSEAINDSIDDYDDVFEELHDKYKGSGKKMAPELRLLMGISGAAFKHHLTKSMFKKQNLPNVQDVLNSDPDLMRSFQRAAAGKMGYSSNGTPLGGGGGGGGLFGMLGNMFGGGGGAKRPQASAPPYQAPRPSGPGPTQPPFRPQQKQQPAHHNHHQQHTMVDPGDIESLIQEVHRDIASTPPPPSNSAARFDSLSVTDEEIASLIEDGSEVGGRNIQTGRHGGGRGGGRKPAGGPRRTLDL